MFDFPKATSVDEAQCELQSRSFIELPWTPKSATWMHLPTSCSQLDQKANNCYARGLETAISSQKSEPHLYPNYLFKLSVRQTALKSFPSWQQAEFCFCFCFCFPVQHSKDNVCPWSTGSSGEHAAPYKRMESLSWVSSVVVQTQLCAQHPPESLHVIYGTWGMRKIYTFMKPVLPAGP